MPIGTGNNSRKPHHVKTKLKTTNAMAPNPHPANTSTFRICEGEPWKMVFSSLIGFLKEGVEVGYGGRI